MKNFLSILFNPIGFNSLHELCQNTIAWKYKLTSIYLLGITVSSLLTAIKAFTEVYIYSPSPGIAILWATTILDIILGLGLAISEKKGIVPTKMGRAISRVAIQTLMVGLFFQMGQTWSYLITSWMVDSLLIIFTLSTFYSVLQNAAALGLITKDQYAFIESIVNIKALIDKLRKK